MEGRWVSVAEAAELRGVTTRTVERWVSTGAVESRLTASGRREVLFTPPTPTPTETENVSARMSEAVAAVEKRAEHGMQAAGAALDAERRLAEALRQHAAAMAAELRTSRRWGRLGWAAAVALLTAGGVASWHVSAELTRMAADVQNFGQDAERLRGELAESSTMVDTARAELDATRSKVAMATARADAQAELAATYRSDSHKARQDAQDARLALSEAEMRMQAAQVDEERLRERLAVLECELAAERDAGTIVPPAPTATTRPAESP